MNLPKDIHSSHWVYTTLYKESTFSIVLEFAMPGSTDNPLHVELTEIESYFYSLQLANAFETVKVKISDVR